ncbi:MAG TPA: transglutaminase family protein [Macromonas sp.]|nr:transglutaminase family protein [Macromonas sp.]
MTPDRRTFLQCAAATSVAAALPFVASSAQAQIPAQPQRTFSPQPGGWRTFDVTTRIDILKPEGATQVWLPVPAVETDWQRSLTSEFTSNGTARLADDKVYGVRLLHVEFTASEKKPWVELTSRVQTRNRAVNWQQRHPLRLDEAGQRFWTAPTQLLPTDGVVREVAVRASRGAHTDVEKVRRIYDWVVENAFREPKTKGCGLGDIKTMLESGYLGGKCADINALFVGLCRAVGIPARDVYGIRVAPSAFGYKELGGNSASLKGAQHCRAEVFLKGYGWVAMDPADVAKVMRQETPEWIKSTRHPLVVPVYQGLFGGWEGNWVGWNMAHDLRLPKQQGRDLPFFMYPTAETAAGPIDPYAPDDFKYQITAKEVTAA